MTAPGRDPTPAANPDGAPSGKTGGHAILVSWGSFMAQSNGSHARVLALLEFLRRRFDRVTLYSYAEHPAEPWTDAQRGVFAERFPDVEMVIDKESRPLKLAKKVKEALVTLFPDRAASILSLSLPGQAPGFARLVQEASGVFVVNYVDGLARLNGVPSARTVVETHDLKFLKRAKMTSTSPVSAIGLTRLRNEVASLGAQAGIIAITQAEAAFFRTMLGSEQIFCASIYDAEAPIKDIVSADQKAVGPYASDHDLLFAASENPLNERGILRFLDTQSDWIGSWRIALCGRICERPEVRKRAAALPNLKLLGFVDDLPTLYRRCRLCLSPTDGTGLKIKVVEALRHGKPVLASPHSMSGLLDGFEQCVFPIEQTTAEKLLSDPAALIAAEEAAKRYYAMLSDSGDQVRLADFLTSLSDPQMESAS